MDRSINQGINLRFMEAINLLVSRNLFSSVSKYGLKYDIKPATLSDIKYSRSQVDLRHIYNICKDFPFINPDYILLGNGEITRRGEQVAVSVTEREILAELLLRVSNLEVKIKKIEDDMK